MVLKNLKIVLENRVIENGYLVLENGLIKQIGEGNYKEDALDCKHLIAMPGFIDIHIHGSAGIDFMDAKEEDYEIRGPVVIYEMKFHNDNDNYDYYRFKVGGAGANRIAYCSNTFPAEIDVDEWPASKQSYGDSSNLRKPDTPPSCLKLFNLRPVKILWV